MIRILLLILDLRQMIQEHIFGMPTLVYKELMAYMDHLLFINLGHVTRILFFMMKIFQITR